MTLYLIKLLYTIKCIHLLKKDYALSLINVNTLYKEKVIMKQKNPKHTQNFITSRKHVKEILKYTNISKQDKVIEIGSGKGHFTKELVEMSQWVTAVEIDENLCKTTEKAVKPFNNIEVIHEDILKFNFPKSNDYKIFGNIPYNISTDIVKKIAFDSQSKYSYLIVERGFAKRLRNTQRALGLLLMLELDIEILKKVPPTYFHPKLSVDSVLIVLERHKPLILKKDYKKYRSFVYKWVNREYHVLFTKNQLRQALKHGNVSDLDKISNEQFLSIFNSYKLFQQF
ncbi:rRNA adenine N-6-methyltransferase [[Clostridium] ultunense Esp]|nr:rRNA adenine N-6-methyltransferase [[Clostridium] ultunense Esp]